MISLSSAKWVITGVPNDCFEENRLYVVLNICEVSLCESCLIFNFPGEKIPDLHCQQGGLLTFFSNFIIVYFGSAHFVVYRVFVFFFLVKCSRWTIDATVQQRKVRYPTYKRLSGENSILITAVKLVQFLTVVDMAHTKKCLKWIYFLKFF